MRIYGENGRDEHPPAGVCVRGAGRRAAPGRDRLERPAALDGALLICESGMYGPGGRSDYAGRARRGRLYWQGDMP